MRDEAPDPGGWDEKHNDSSKGTCFGYEIQSRLDFRYLRARGEGTPLHIEQGSELREVAPTDLLYEWRPRPDRPFHARLHRADDSYALWIEHMGWFYVDPVTPSISAPRSPDPVLLEERLWGIPASLCVLARGDLPLHAAAVEIDGVAVLLAAPGRSGKTTLVSALLEAGFGVLSEDLACCRATPTGPAVVPGPAMLRVRHDSYHRLNLRQATVVAEDSERYHLAINPRLRGDSSPVPIRSIVFLRWGAPSQRPRLNRAPPADAVRYLWSLAFHLPIDAVRAQCFDLVSALAAEADLWDLSRPVDFEYLGETVDRVVAMCRP